MHQQNFLSKTRSPYFGSQRPWTFTLIGMLLLITQVATLAHPPPPRYGSLVVFHSSGQDYSQRAGRLAGRLLRGI